VRVRIHRGAHEVGGSCVELETAGRRLVVDLGRPLNASRDDYVPLPDIAGLAAPDPSLVGVVISHGHPDHHGLAHLLHDEVPIYVGAASYKVLNAAAFFTGAEGFPEPTRFLRDREPLELGPFRLTPYLADHSAFDAYSLLIEAGGRRLFYSGDLRAHGRKATVFERLLADPPSEVHALLLEGTHVRSGDAPNATAQSEGQLEAACTKAFRETTGMVLACYSAQNIDRLVTLFKATLRADRDFVMDLYTASVAAAIGYDTIPQSDWDRVRVFLPSSQRQRVIREQAFERTDAVRSRRIYPEELVTRRSELVMTFRESMATDLERANCLSDARLMWSMWPGYLDSDKTSGLRAFCERNAVPVTIQHASGHAAVEDLQRLAAAVQPDRVVPIHTSAPERFREYFSNVERHLDGQWWTV
jgi:ribonuclease J